MNIKYLRLQDIAEVSAGGTPKRSEPAFWQNGSIPWVKIKDIKSKYISETEEYITKQGMEKSSAKLFPKGTILYTIFATLGECAILDIDATTNQAIAGINITSDEVLTDYLYYYLKSIKSKVINEGRGVAQNNINLKILRNITVPIPSFDMQRKIIEILKTTENILFKRQQQLQALTALKQSIFLDNFKGNKRYPNVKLKEVITSIKAGLSTGGENRKKDEGELGVLTTSAVTYGVFDPKAFKVPPKDKIKEKKLVFPTKDSILVSRMNTKELVGAACIVEEDYTELFIPDRLWKLVPNAELINPYYLISVIQSRLFRIQIDRISTGTSGSMQNISQKNYLDLEIPLIDLETQNKYASKVSAINHKLKMLNSSLVNIKMLYEVLLHKAFNGELFQEAIEV
ncbi:restriction endonuclease subunit S [Oceanobacillus sp. AG]|uniref:restriction endonuclease subunit S n=1 Tax=Oceanobacillus sp. AG TaxID=2681969 RepID=UPI0012EBBA89|nr:restriction endonuclease subunit S [Oceanobacillus sp. AG]